MHFGIIKQLLKNKKIKNEIYSNLYLVFISNTF